jgi:hypothetical protein
MTYISMFSLPCLSKLYTDKFNILSNASPPFQYQISFQESMCCSQQHTVIWSVKLSSNLALAKLGILPNCIPSLAIPDLYEWGPYSVLFTYKCHGPTIGTNNCNTSHYSIFFIRHCLTFSLEANL